MSRRAIVGAAPLTAALLFIGLFFSNLFVGPAANAAGSSSSVMDFVIVEYNPATRPTRSNLSEQSDAIRIRKAMAEEQQQAENERRYVEQTVTQWKTRYSLPDSNIKFLHSVGTSPFVIEASREVLTKILAAATWNERINVTTSTELFDFEIQKLETVFNTTDEALLGEFVEASLKNEMLFSIWNALHAGPEFSKQKDVYQTVVRMTANVTLEKLDQLEHFLRQRGTYYFPSLLHIHRIARHILTGLITIESVGGSNAFPTPSSFFKALELFKDLGMSILLTSHSAAEKIPELWLQFQSRSLELPNSDQRDLSANSRLLFLLGHRSANIRNEFALNLATLILDYENTGRTEVTGVENERLIRLTLAVAQSQEKFENDQRIAHGLPARVGRQRIQRRLKIAEELLQKSHPDAKVFFGAKPSAPSQLLFKLMDELVAHDRAENNFGATFSLYFYRLSALKVFDLVIRNAENPALRRYVIQQFNKWASSLRSEKQTTGFEPMVALIDQQVSKLERKTCEGLFVSTP